MRLILSRTALGSRATFPLRRQLECGTPFASAVAVLWRDESAVDSVWPDESSALSSGSKGSAVASLWPDEAGEASGRPGGPGSGGEEREPGDRGWEPVSVM